MIATSGVDWVAIATGGTQHQDDPGMSDFEQGHEPFQLGVRVEVRMNTTWHKGTVVETTAENDRAIVVECDERVHDNLEHRDGRGATVMVYMNTRRGILSSIRLIDEPRREVVIPRFAPPTLEGNAQKLLEILDAAVAVSEGHLRVAWNEEDESDDFTRQAARFLKFDGKRVGRDLEVYRFMAEIEGWEHVLATFLVEVIMPLETAAPEGYAKATDMVRTLGRSVYTGEHLAAWLDLFKQEA